MPRPITVQRIDHVSLLSPDPERTAGFYTDLLGFTRIDEASGPEGTAQISVGGEDGLLMTIVDAAGGSEGEIGIGTIHHVAFTVGAIDGLLKWKRRLHDGGVLVYGPYENQAYRDLVFTDPDGVLLEIATAGPGWDVTQDGEDVYTPPAESMAPFRDEEQIHLQIWPDPVPAVEPDMVLAGFHHVATIVSSLQASDDFYQHNLGLSLVRKSTDPDDPEVEQWYWGLDGGRPGTLVTGFPIVHVHEGGKAIYGRAGIGVIDHFALRGELAGTAAENEQAQPVTLHSPDGQVVEIVPAPGAVSGAEE